MAQPVFTGCIINSEVALVFAILCRLNTLLNYLAPYNAVYNAVVFNV